MLQTVAVTQLECRSHRLPAEQWQSDGASAKKRSVQLIALFQQTALELRNELRRIDVDANGMM